MLEELDPPLRPVQRDRQVTREGQARIVKRRPVQETEQTPLGDDGDTFESLEFHIAWLCARDPKPHAQIADG